MVTSRRSSGGKRASTGSAKGRSDGAQARSGFYEDAPVAYVSMDDQGIVQGFNLRARALLGIGISRGVGLPFRAFVTTRDRSVFSLHLARFRAEGRADDELHLKVSDGREVAVRMESQRSGGAAERCWTALFDLTDRESAEVEHARLESAERAAREANVVKDRFIAVLSHELRAPLAPLLAAVASLESQATSAEKLPKLAAMIKRNVLREARLIDDLLDVSRIASGKVNLQRVPTDLHAAACEAVEMLSPETAARQQTLAIELGASRHQVNGDPARLRQIFTNLLKNAVKFTPEGGHIALRSWNHGARVIVEVSDDGMGIEPRALSQIFESFEQGRGAARAGGLGLGLAICRAMIGLHDGTISAQSPGPGQGARFLVELPVLTEAALPAREAAPPARRPAKRSARGGEILLVEDEPDLAVALLDVLEAEGYRAWAVATASEALAANLDHVKVVISDLGLPDLDGRQLVERLKSKHDLKAIALSGYGTEADVLASQAAGFDQHLTKPVEMDVLLSAIDRVCAT